MSDIEQRLRDAHPSRQPYALGSNILPEAADHIAALEAALKKVSGYTGRLEFQLAAEREKVQMLRDALDEISAKALQATAPEQAGGGDK